MANVQIRDALGACALLLAIGGGPAFAGVAECDADINELRVELAEFCDGDETDGKEVLGRHPTRTCDSLNSKLDGADEKLDALKLDRAQQKLEDFSDGVNDLETATKPKIIGDVSGLDATEAIACIQDLIDSL